MKVGNIHKLLMEKYYSTLEGIQKNELDTERVDVLIIQFFPQELPTPRWFSSVTTKMLVDWVVQVWYIHFNLKWSFNINHENFLKYYKVNYWKMLSCFKKIKNVPEQSADPITSVFVAAILRLKTLFLSKGFWSTWWKFSTVSCPVFFRWTDQSKNGAGAAAKPVKLSQHSWRYTVAGTDFLHEAVSSPHTGRFHALEKYFASCFFLLPYFRIAFATSNPPINLTLCYLYRDLRARCVTTVVFVASAQTVDIYNPSSSREPWRLQTKTRLTIRDPFVVIIVDKKKVHR